MNKEQTETKNPLYDPLIDELNLIYLEKEEAGVDVDGFKVHKIKGTDIDWPINDSIGGQYITDSNFKSYFVQGAINNTAVSLDGQVKILSEGQVNISKQNDQGQYTNPVQVEIKTLREPKEIVLNSGSLGDMLYNNDWYITETLEETLKDHNSNI